MISHQYRFIYFHIPRTAGTSIEDALWRYRDHNQKGPHPQDHPDYYGNYDWHYEFSDFPYFSIKDIHKYLVLRLFKEYSSRPGEIFFPYESLGTQKTEFEEEEIQFIKSISRNNNEFDVSLLKDSYKGMWGAGDLYGLSIDKKNNKRY